MLVARGYDTARQFIERQRAAVRGLALELLDAESLDADRMKQIMAEHVGGRSVSLSPAAERSGDLPKPRAKAGSRHRKALDAGSAAS